MERLTDTVKITSYIDNCRCTVGINSTDGYVSSILRSSFPDIGFSDEVVFTNVFFCGGIRDCLLILEQLDSVIDVVRKQLNENCKMFRGSSVSGSYRGTVRMNDGSVRQLDLILVSISDDSYKDLCRCVVAIFTSNSEEKITGYDICYSVRDIESGKCVVGAVEF